MVRVKGDGTQDLRKDLFFFDEIVIIAPLNYKVFYSERKKDSKEQGFKVPQVGSQLGAQNANCQEVFNIPLGMERWLSR